MIKVICCILLLLICAFIFNEPHFSVFVRAFGYEGSPSVFFLLACATALGYIWHLLGAPGRWIRRFRQQRLMHHAQNEQEKFGRILNAYLGQDTAEQQKILKNLTGPLSLIIQALFAPQKKLFEKMLQDGSYKAAALKGLYDDAVFQGDGSAARLVLQQALNVCPALKWVQTARFNQALDDNDMTTAFQVLEGLKKNDFITKADYTHQKALLFLRQGDVKTAFHLAADDIQVVLAYCLQTPQKAKKVLINAFTKTPDERLYRAYKDLFTDETPLQKIKAVNILTQNAPMDKISLLAKADMAISCGLWGVAKETVESYLNAFVLTPQTALMMARIERDGFHHLVAAQEWEQKALDMMS